MPRQKSDTIRQLFTVDPETLEALLLAAAHHGWLTDSGEPNRSMAVRELAKREAKRIARKKPK